MARDKVKLVSTEGTGCFYTTDKNKKNTPDKLGTKNGGKGFKKYDWKLRKHVEFKEEKIK